jgi:hypothetical protein
MNNLKIKPLYEIQPAGIYSPNFFQGIQKLHAPAVCPEDESLESQDVFKFPLPHHSSS